MAVPIPSVLEMMRAMIGSPSISSADPHLDQSNIGVIHLLAEWMEATGFAVEIQRINDRKANLIAILGGSEAMDGLVLSGHTDTVPFDEGRWSMDPFAGTIRNDALYGLGSADMKSFLALAVLAASRVDPRQIKRPLVILATADEESSMSGARLLAEQGRRLGRYCVIGEPTGLKPIRMHKGVMMEAIHVDGQSGHSSDPELGANAIEGMHAILSALLTWRKQMQSDHHNPAFRVPYPTLNLGAIRGGDNPNRICGHCSLTIDLRPLPGMPLDGVRKELNRRVSAALDDYPRLRGGVDPLFAGLPPFETPADSELVRVCEGITGHRAEAVAFGTEAPLLSQLGLETLVLGPGHIDQAHQPDEFLPLAHIDPCLTILEGLIGRFCLSRGAA
jgi:acetylornithine deacetylase